MYNKLFWVLTDINVAYILYFFFTKDRKLIKNLIPLHLCKMISYVCLHCCFSGIQLFVTLWTIASVAPLSVGFSRQENAGLGCHAPLQEIFPTQRSNQASLTSPALAGRFFISPLSMKQRRQKGYDPWSLQELDRTEQLSLHVSTISSTWEAPRWSIIIC